MGKDDFGSGSIKFKLAGSLVAITAGAAAAPAASPAPGSANATGTANTGNSKDTGPTSAGTQTASQYLATLQQASKSPISVSTVAALEALRYQATAVKVPAKGPLYSLVADDPFYYRSNLSPQYVPGTFLLSTLGTAAEDNSLVVVQSVGGILTAILSMTTASLVGTVGPGNSQPQPLKLPFVLDLSEGLAKVPCASPYDLGEKWCQIDGTDWSYWVQAIPVPATLDTEKFFAEATKANGGSYRHIFPVSTCQPIRLYLRADHAQFNGTTPSQPTTYVDLTIANPSAINGVRIPSKGTIAMPDVCGANVTVNASGSPSDLDVLNAIAQQAIAIQKANAAQAKPASPPSKTGGAAK